MGVGRAPPVPRRRLQRRQPRPARPRPAAGAGGAGHLRPRRAHLARPPGAQVRPPGVARGGVRAARLRGRVRRPAAQPEPARSARAADPRRRCRIRTGAHRRAAAPWPPAPLPGRHARSGAGPLRRGTPPPYGYAVDPDRPRAPVGVRVDPVAAAVVGELFARYLEPGQSLAGLVKDLTAAGIPAPSGGAHWSMAGLRRLLTNPAYTGTVYAGRSRVYPIGRRRSPLAAVGRRLRGSRPSPPEAWILVGHIPAVVSQEQFDQVQAKLVTNARFARRNNRVHHYLLRALVSCGQCRLTCRGQTRCRYAYYACAGKDHPALSGREQRCPSRLVPARQLDELVWADLCALLQDPASIAQALERAQAGAWLPQELQARRDNLRRAAASLSQQLERLTQAYLEQILGLEEYRRRRHDLEARIEALARQARQLEAEATRRVDVAQAGAHVEAFCRRVRESLA